MSRERNIGETDAIQDGVIAAVMRVAAVSAPGTRELVLEFDAARDAIRCRAFGGRFEHIFCEGLAVDRFRSLMRDGRYEQPRLPLRRGLELLDDEDEVEEYRSLVLEAVDAAAKAETSSRTWTTRARYLERIAIREIENALIASLA